MSIVSVSVVGSSAWVQAFLSSMSESYLRCVYDPQLCLYYKTSTGNGDVLLCVCVGDIETKSTQKFSFKRSACNLIPAIPSAGRAPDLLFEAHCLCQCGFCLHFFAHLL